MANYPGGNIASTQVGGVKWVWDMAGINLLNVVWPQEAHLAAGKAAAAAAAAAVHSHETGQLARDVGTPKPVSPTVTEIGSNLIYARVQDQGKVITAKRGKPMLIHGSSRGTGYAPYSVHEMGTGRFLPRSVKGENSSITASAWQVEITAKHYLDAAPPAYIATFLRVYGALAPG